MQKLGREMSDRLGFNFSSKLFSSIKLASIHLIPLSKIATTSLLSTDCRSHGHPTCAACRNHPVDRLATYTKSLVRLVTVSLRVFILISFRDFESWMVRPDARRWRTMRPPAPRLPRTAPWRKSVENKHCDYCVLVSTTQLMIFDLFVSFTISAPFVLRIKVLANTLMLVGRSPAHRQVNVVIIIPSQLSRFCQKHTSDV